MHELRVLSRWATERTEHSMAAFLHSSTFQSTPETGTWVRYDRSKRRKGFKAYAAPLIPWAKGTYALEPIKRTATGMRNRGGWAD
jgi:hypothetical protein